MKKTSRKNRRAAAGGARIIAREGTRRYNHAMTPRDLTFVLVSHDLAVIAHMCDRVLVMQNGDFVDELTKADLEAGVTHSAYSGELFESSFL